MSKAIVLRDYQEAFVNGVETRWKEGVERVLGVLPTAGGKTVCGLTIAQRALARGHRVLWLAHRSELVMQPFERAKQMGIDRVGIVKADVRNPDRTAPIQMASIQTLLARGIEMDFDTVIADEAHHMRSDEWGKLITKWPRALQFGLTATPQRADRKPMGDAYQVIVEGPQPADLIANGALTPCEVVAPPSLIKKGIAWEPVEAWKRFAQNQSTIVFCSSIPQSKALVDRFRANDVVAAHLDMDTPPDARAKTLRDFDAGRIKVLCNVMLLTEGFDSPPTRVCMLARPCGSASMFIQCCGRVMRPSPETKKSKALLIDLAGSVYKFGTPDQDRIYNLWGDEGISTKGGGNLDNLKCKECGCIAPKTPEGACTVCGFLSPKAEKSKEPDIKDRELKFMIQIKRSPDRVEAYARLMIEARQKKFKYEWASRRFYERYGHWPEATWIQWVEARIFTLFPEGSVPHNWPKLLEGAINEAVAA